MIFGVLVSAQVSSNLILLYVEYLNFSRLQNKNYILWQICTVHKSYGLDLCKTWLRMQKKGSISTTEQIASYTLSHFAKKQTFLTACKNTMR